MSGIIILIVLLLWGFVVKKVSYYCVYKMQTGNKKVVVQGVVFLLVFIAPVVDDILGGFQFRAMCSPENLLEYDAEKIAGKTIKTIPTKNYHVDNILVPIWVTHTRWVDYTTGEILIDHKIMYSKGGWLSRSIGIQRDDSCDTNLYYEIFNQLGITVVDS